MPANKKHLTQSGWTKTSKVLAILIGGMFASFSIHIALALYVGYDAVIPTSFYTIFMLWGFFMILVYWIKSPWKSWGLLLALTVLSVFAIYIAKT